MCVCVCAHEYSFVYTGNRVQFCACVCVCTCVAPTCTVHAAVAWSDSGSESRLIFTHRRAPYHRIIVALVTSERRREISIIYDDDADDVYLEKGDENYRLLHDGKPTETIFTVISFPPRYSANAYNHLYECTSFRKRTRTRRLRCARTR